MGVIYNRQWWVRMTEKHFKDLHATQIFETDRMMKGNCYGRDFFLIFFGWAEAFSILHTKFTSCDPARCTYITHEQRTVLWTPRYSKWSENWPCRVCDVRTSIKEALIKLMHSCTQEKFVMSFACPYHHRIFSVSTSFSGFDFHIFLTFYAQLFRNTWWYRATDFFKA